MFVIKKIERRNDYEDITYLSNLVFNNWSYIKYSTVNSVKSEDIFKFPSKDLACSICRWLNKCYPFSFSVVNIFKTDEKIDIFHCPEDCYQVDKNGNMLNTNL